MHSKVQAIDLQIFRAQIARKIGSSYINIV